MALQEIDALSISILEETRPFTDPAQTQEQSRVRAVDIEFGVAVDWDEGMAAEGQQEQQKRLWIDRISLSKLLSGVLVRLDDAHMIAPARCCYIWINGVMVVKHSYCLLRNSPCAMKARNRPCRHPRL